MEHTWEVFYVFYVLVVAVVVGGGGFVACGCCRQKYKNTIGRHILLCLERYNGTVLSDIDIPTDSIDPLLNSRSSAAQIKPTVLLLPKKGPIGWCWWWSSLSSV
jgi:hypothetical protein